MELHESQLKCVTDTGIQIGLTIAHTWALNLYNIADFLSKQTSTITPFFQ